MSEGAVPRMETPEVVGQTEETGESTGAWQTLVGSLPEGLQQDVNIGRHQSFESMANEYANLVPAIGKKGVLLPKADDVQDVHRFLKELGRPDAPDGYDLTEFTPNEGMPWSQENQDSLLKLCHDSGVTQGQLGKLLNGYTNLQMEQYQSIIDHSQNDYDTQAQVLQKELGASYQRSVNLASRAIEHLFKENGESMLQARLADGTVLGNNPTFIKGMIELAGLIGEDNLVSDGGMMAPGAMTPAEAKSKIAAKQNDKDFMDAYLTPSHAGHPAANAEMDSLYAQAHPNDK